MATQVQVKKKGPEKDPPWYIVRNEKKKKKTLEKKMAANKDVANIDKIDWSLVDFSQIELPARAPEPKYHYEDGRAFHKHPHRSPPQPQTNTNSKSYLLTWAVEKYTCIHCT
jgi:hypothetical protein